MGEVTTLNRTLEQELFALLRGASLECLVCGEFVMHVGPAVYCSECHSHVADATAGEGTGTAAVVEVTAG